jgi:hypothetical protein
MSIPVAQVLAFVGTFINTIPAIKFRTLDGIDREFVEACVAKFIPEYTSRIGMINYLIAIVDHSIINDINMDDLEHHDIQDYPSNTIGLDDVRQIIANKHKGLVPWIDAMYAGIWLMHTEIQLKVARMDKDHALHALADLDINDEDSDLSDGETNMIESFSADLDYFII